jgi:hypothetical protein
MAAPIEQVHRHGGRIGHLHNENLVAGNGANGVWIDAARECVKAVEDQPDIWMIGAAHDFPCIPVIENVPPPGKRFVADFEATLCCALPEFAKIGRRAVDPAESGRGDT